LVSATALDTARLVHFNKGTRCLISKERAIDKV
jgi:hypothetical protein